MKKNRDVIDVKIMAEHADVIDRICKVVRELSNRYMDSDIDIEISESRASDWVARAHIRDLSIEFNKLFIDIGLYDDMQALKKVVLHEMAHIISPPYFDYKRGMRRAHHREWKKTLRKMWHAEGINEKVVSYIELPDHIWDRWTNIKAKKGGRNE